MGEHAFLQLRELFGLRDDAPALVDGDPQSFVLVQDRPYSLSHGKRLGKRRFDSVTDVASGIGLEMSR